MPQSEEKDEHPKQEPSGPQEYSEGDERAEHGEGDNSRSPRSKQGIDHVPSVKLADGKQIHRGHEESKPGRQRGRMQENG